MRASVRAVGALCVITVVLLCVANPGVGQEVRQFTIEQDGNCVTVTPLGDGSDSVEEFYNYQSPPNGRWSSYGTTGIQGSQVSQLFIYYGEDGLSLVFLHDENGDGNGGFVATAEIEGLPSSGEWVIEDDSYSGRDDVFRHSGSSSHIEWFENGNRTDGGVFRGLSELDGDTITVDIDFNEDSDNYPFNEWSGSNEDNEIEDWIVRSGDGDTEALDMDESVEISSGSCSVKQPTTTTQTPSTTQTSTTTKTPTPTTTKTPTPTTTQTPTPTTTQTPTPTTTQPTTTRPTTTQSTANESTPSRQTTQPTKVPTTTEEITTPSTLTATTGQLLGVVFSINFWLLVAIILAVIAYVRWG